MIYRYMNRFFFFFPCQFFAFFSPFFQRKEQFYESRVFKTQLIFFVQERKRRGRRIPSARGAAAAHPLLIPQACHTTKPQHKHFHPRSHQHRRCKTVFRFRGETNREASGSVSETFGGLTAVDELLRARAACDNIGSVLRRVEGTGRRGERRLSKNSHFPLDHEDPSLAGRPKFMSRAAFQQYY